MGRQPFQDCSVFYSGTWGAGHRITSSKRAAPGLLIKVLILRTLTAHRPMGFRIPSAKIVPRFAVVRETRLAHLAKETGRSKSYYVKQAIENFLEEREEYLLALSVLEKDEPRTSIVDVRKELGLER